MKQGLPFVGRGQSVGLFGGTFDPPHAGHLLVAQRALRIIGLDQLWWMPSPINPLKSRQPAPLETRMKHIKAFATQPKMHVTDIEARLGARYTVDTVSNLKTLYPHVQFVLICGADILPEFHHWKHWRNLAHSIPICAFARPGQQLRAGLSPFALSFARYRLEPEEARNLRYTRPPAWALIPGSMINLSSTELRAQNEPE